MTTTPDPVSPHDLAEALRQAVQHMDFRAVTGVSRYNGSTHKSGEAVLPTLLAVTPKELASMPTQDTPTPPQPTTKDIERFNAKVHRTDSCWEWTGSRRHDGYGQFRYKGTVGKAHRFAWFFFYGEWPDLYVCHRCDNPSCVNPDHLFLGTHQDNVADMVAKDRQRNGASYGKCAGENHPAAKLTQEQIDMIRSGHFGDMLQREIADLLGVSQTQISKVQLGVRWTHA